jgi:signal transduction histidine kinase
MFEKMSIETNQDSKDDSNYQRYESLTEPSKSFSPLGPDQVFPPPYRALIFLVITVVSVECFIEIVLATYFPINLMVHILLDSSLVVILLSPFFYHFLYLPYKRHHEYHNKAQGQIHYLSRQLINNSEKERKLLSQNLHDGFGQVLTSMQFGVEAMKSPCMESGVNRASCLVQAEKLSQQISDLGDFVRSVSTDLHPHMLDELGLMTTLKYHLDEFESQYEGIKIDSVFSVNETRIPPEIELVIFRVCQESLNNIVKHAKASNVVLNLLLEDGILSLCIEDDGQGFDLLELKAMGAKRRGIGLLGMRERVAALGGRLFLNSALGKGTSIQAKIPMKLRRRKHEADTGLDR